MQAAGPAQRQGVSRERKRQCDQSSEQEWGCWGGRLECEVSRESLGWNIQALGVTNPQKTILGEGGGRTGMWTQSQETLTRSKGESLPLSQVPRRDRLDGAIKPESSRAQGLAMAGVKAGARPAVQEAQVGRKGGTAGREVC